MGSLNASDILHANKPYGISSHQTDAHKPGFIEWLQREHQKNLFICHRLDKQTTGCFIVATHQQACAQIGELWQTGQVKKTYHFITDRRPQQKSWTQKSLIEKKDSRWVSTPSMESPSLAKTEFSLVKEEHGYFLLEARPLTGKTHQIRLHAQDAGVPLLGDTTYGGTPYPLHFLHCSEIRFLDFCFSSQLPQIYHHLEWLRNPMMAQWLTSVDRRQRLYPDLLNNEHCVRLIHNEGTPLRLDLLGDVACAGWWSETPANTDNIQAVAHLMRLLGYKKWYLQDQSRQKKSEEKFLLDSAPETWTAKENCVTYEFTKSIGAAPGLFLDQRNHRKWLQLHSQSKKVLNLFAYTGGFSLNAAHGGAQYVVTVDLSPKYIEWTRRNFALNHLDTTPHGFYAMDSMEYLKYAQKKGFTFDIIICDPPSFSRGKKSRFQIDKDFGHLIDHCLAVLAPKGTLLFSSNFEDWSSSQWEDRLGRLKSTQNTEIINNFSMQWDFEWWAQESLMKSFKILKK